MEFHADCRNDGCDGVNSTEIVNEINKAICVVRVKTLRKRLFVLLLETPCVTCQCAP